MYLRACVCVCVCCTPCNCQTDAACALACSNVSCSVLAVCLSVCLSACLCFHLRVCRCVHLYAVQAIWRPVGAYLGVCLSVHAFDTILLSRLVCILSFLYMPLACVRIGNMHIYAAVSKSDRPTYDVWQVLMEAALALTRGVPRAYLLPSPHQRQADAQLTFKPQITQKSKVSPDPWTLNIIPELNNMSPAPML